MIIHKPPEWMFYNHLTHTIDTQDGTKIGAEHFGDTHWSQVCSVLDLNTDALTLAIMRDEQRKAIKARGEQA